MKKLLLLLFPIILSAQTGPLSIVNGVIDFHGAGTSTLIIKTGVSLPGTCAVLQMFGRTSDNTVWYCSAVNTWTQFAASAPSTTSHAINLLWNGGTSALAGDNGFFPGNGPLTGTISRVDISGGGTAGAACSITIDIWKRNAAIPTSGNKISASAPATLSSANLSQSGSLSGWSTSVAANDVWSGTVATNTGCITALVQVWYQ